MHNTRFLIIRPAQISLASLSTRSFRTKLRITLRVFLSLVVVAGLYCGLHSRDRVAGRRGRPRLDFIHGSKRSIIHAESTRLPSLTRLDLSRGKAENDAAPHNRTEMNVSSNDVESELVFRIFNLYKKAKLKKKLIHTANVKYFRRMHI